jgi:hypothetical protein
VTLATVFSTSYSILGFACIIVLILGEFTSKRLVPFSRVVKRVMATRTVRLSMWLAWWWYGYHFLISTITH